MAQHGTSAEDGPSPAVAALLRALVAHPWPQLVLLHVDPGHPEADLARRAAALASVATEALAYLAGEARCGHLADSLWEQVAALEDAPAIRALVPDRATQLADHRVEVWLEDRALGTGPFTPGGQS
ncbi:hypothetical protein [Roseomonas indoligenes]|uniref:Uncharacterized protein n=1 Tax=Roseomonas indoligenes TaxID=2820811 RepID=A0A940S8F2_9PROT|nr:hypothetical protein [Pararoseomonas indoligenes]MBP0496034.1 hypothetical protein [Pararoseomonas indoligenes]